MRFVDPKSEVSAPMYCFEGSPLRYSVFAWILVFVFLAKINSFEEFGCHIDAT